MGAGTGRESRVADGTVVERGGGARGPQEGPVVVEAPDRPAAQREDASPSSRKTCPMPRATFRFYEELNDHLPPERRKVDFEHPVKLIHTVRGVGFMLREGEP